MRVQYQRGPITEPVCNWETSSAPAGRSAAHFRVDNELVPVPSLTCPGSTAGLGDVRSETWRPTRRKDKNDHPRKNQTSFVPCLHISKSCPGSVPFVPNSTGLQVLLRLKTPCRGFRCIFIQEDRSPSLLLSLVSYKVNAVSEQPPFSMPLQNTAMPRPQAAEGQSQTHSKASIGRQQCHSCGRFVNCDWTRIANGHIKELASHQ